MCWPVATSSPHNWQAPPSRFIKVNADALVDESGCVGLGVVAWITWVGFHVQLMVFAKLFLNQIVQFLFLVFQNVCATCLILTTFYRTLL